MLSGTEQTESAGPLSGVRVVDMTTVIMGPYATAILGDYGADVIKVEPPGGDVMRHGGHMRNPGMGALFLQINRNKRSIVLDVKQEAGRAALLRLCETADVFVHNVRPAGMRRARLGEDDLRAINPRLVYVSLVGYGQSGPYAPLPAYDDLFQGRVGIASLIGSVNGIDPRFVPVTICDRIVGLNAVHTVLAALFQRERTGKGQAVELPMLETMAQFVLGDHMGGRSFEPPLGPPGYSRLTTSDRRPYKTRDGYICTLVYTDAQWRAFYRAIGRSDEEFAADPRLQSAASRAKHFGALYAFVAEELAKKTTAEWIDILQRNDIPAGPLNDLDALIDDEHLTAVGFFRAMQHPTEGPVRMVGIPSRWSNAAPSIRRHTPNLGEHSEEILHEAGFTEQEVEELIASGAAAAFRECEKA
ncbi:MAG TPA: CoA transferase [Xanthobacteraceae bacterium]|nr:CoA transferase [Xanthobacteraceae bacterium]